MATTRAETCRRCSVFLSLSDVLCLTVFIAIRFIENPTDNTRLHENEYLVYEKCCIRLTLMMTDHYVHSAGYI
jgi:hypothetical protein